MNVPFLPALNACLNATAAILLVLGYRAVKGPRRDTRLHQWIMVGALAASAAFLAFYIYYHATSPGITRFDAAGLWRPLYFTILLTHTVLATGIVPFVFAAVWFAYRGQYVRHVRITRRLWPVWMYVSVTGVLIFVLLYVYPGEWSREGVGL